MSQPSRQQSMREMQMRLMQTLEKTGQLDVDLTGLPEDMEVAWITESIRGLPTDSLVMNAMDRGYRVATVTDLPKTRLPSLPGRANGSGDEPIRFQGSILMIRPKDLGNCERDFYRRETEAGIRDAAHRLQRVESPSGDPTTDGELTYVRPDNAVKMTYERGRLSPKIEE